jgi:hypothetical protein
MRSGSGRVRRGEMERENVSRTGEDGHELLFQSQLNKI